MLFRSEEVLFIQCLGSLEECTVFEMRKNVLGRSIRSRIRISAFPVKSFKIDILFITLATIKCVVEIQGYYKTVSKVFRILY